MQKKVIILGASGSIGIQALNVIRNNNDKYLLTKISIGNNVSKLIEILDEFDSIEEVALLNDSSLDKLKEVYPSIRFKIGKQGILDLLDNDYDITLNAIVGFAGLFASIKVIQQNKTLALANKETMVVAGDIINKLLLEYTDAKIIPVDSEHCAIFQCLHGKKEDVKRLLISASGGSFRDLSIEQLQSVSVSDALNHPNWNMGASITIDSATMFNKGLEVIEAHYLFDVPYHKIDVLLHRESIVHSMVEYIDGSIIAQLSNPNMEQPISYALAYPQRVFYDAGSLDFSKIINLSFEPIDMKRYEALQISYEAGLKGHSFPCVLNASKEVATQAFLNNEISFLEIVEFVKKALAKHKVVKDPNLADLEAIDKATRTYVLNLIKGSI